MEGNDSVVLSYGHDRQRISMEERVGNMARTKRYVEACEYVTETSGNHSHSKTITHLTSSMGVFAVVETEDGFPLGGPLPPGPIIGAGIQPLRR